MSTVASLLAALYIALPLAGVAVAMWLARRQHNPKPIVSFGLSVFSAGVMSAAICLLMAQATGGSASIGQILLTAYLLIGVLTLLKGFSWLLKEGAERLFIVHPSQGAGRRRGVEWAFRLAGATLTRVTILFALGIPYIMSLGMVYRPKVTDAESPREQLGVAYEDVQFASTDGVRLSGWWIATQQPMPTTSPATQRSRGDWGRKTAIVCHGLGAGKSNQLLLARDLIINGYNVLIFDFRAHGDSGGQLSSFGDRERFDVLGAVRWLRENRPEQSRKIVGLGVSMGGAALMSAAAEDSPEARAIDAVAVLSTFDHFSSIADDLTDNYLIQPVGWLARNVGVPLAGALAGSDLENFSPARAADRIAPRPVMVIHGRGDALIPFETGVRLFERVQMPKVRLWVGELNSEHHYVIRTNARYVTDDKGIRQPQPPVGPPADHNNLIFYDDGLKAIRLFFDEAKAMS